MAVLLGESVPVKTRILFNGFRRISLAGGYSRAASVQVPMDFKSRVKDDTAIAGPF